MSPPGPARAIFLVARLALRRWVNRFAAIASRRKKKEGETPVRTGTPRKTRPKILFPLIMGLLFLFSGVNLASQFLRKVSLHVGRGPAGDVLRVGPASFTLLARTDDSGADLESALLRGPLQADGILDESERRARAREIAEVFGKRGMEGFREDARGRAPIYMSESLWPSGEAEHALLRVLGAVFLVMGLSQILTSLGSTNQDLGRVEWSLEWYFTLPVSAGTLFLAKVFEFALVNGHTWFMTFPLFLTVLWASGWEGWAIPLAAAAAVFFALMLASVRLLVETGLRTAFPLTRLKNFQAAFTLSGSILMLGLLGLAITPAVPPALIEAAARLPGAALWNPLSLPALLAARGAAPWIPAAAMLACAVAGPLIAIRLSERRVRGGLLSSSGASYGGSRRASGAVPVAERGLFRGIVGKELRLLLRDRNFFVQTLVVPIIIFAFNLIAYPGIVRGVTSDFRHASVLAFGMGAYVLMFGAMNVLTLEGGALWLLYTVPRDLYGILVRKTLLWGAFALGYAVLVLAGVALAGGGLTLEAAPTAATALAGVGIYAFICGGLGILATDPLETEVHRRMRGEMVQLYLMLSAMFALTIYTPSDWGRLVQVVLTALLATALWQKVRDRMPYLLDPTELPPPRLALSDGLIAVLAFFVLQGLLTLLFIRTGLPLGRVLLLGYGVAGAIVVVLTLYMAWRLKVPRLLEAVGLRSPEGGVTASLAWGAAGGALAAGAGVLYLKALDAVPALRAAAEEQLRYSMASNPDLVSWIVPLALVAAPLFEEFIFRGLVYRGLRTTVRPAWAIPASAAIFAIVHSPVSVVPVFAMGVVAAAAFERSKLLLAPILVHLTYNAIVVFWK